MQLLLYEQIIRYLCEVHLEGGAKKSFHLDFLKESVVLLIFTSGNSQLTNGEAGDEPAYAEEHVGLGEGDDQPADEVGQHDGLQQQPPPHRVHHHATEEGPDRVRYHA